MRIKYTTRSQFFEPIRAALLSGRETLNAGGVVKCQLSEPGGYSGEVEVEILDDDASLFQSTWEGTDPTRFPARIRAAAAVLRDSGYRGKYRICHRDGTLEISRI